MAEDSGNTRNEQQQQRDLQSRSSSMSPNLLTSNSNNSIKAEPLNVSSISSSSQPAQFKPIVATATTSSPVNAAGPVSSTLSQQIQQEQADSSPISSQLNKMMKRGKKDTEKKFLLNDEDFN